ncbi:MAG: hypothetical protein KA764_10765, partial [Anaerolineales bacterium]|nr:hypothetical protein [Anaerolineales bacterium]
MQKLRAMWVRWIDGRRLLAAHPASAKAEPLTARRAGGIGLLVVLIVGLLTAGAGAAALVAWEPYSPGDALYPLQSWTEGARLRFVGDPTERAAAWLDALEFRLQDLAYRAGTPDELYALGEFTRTLDQTLAAIDAAPAEAQTRLRGRLAALLTRYEQTLQRLTVLERVSPRLLARYLNRAETLLALVAGPRPTRVALANLPAALPDALTAVQPLAALAGAAGIAPHAIPFPTGSQAGGHAFFPLVGRHAEAACTACHTNGQYRGTPRDCAGCHAAETPAEHFPGDCVRCHTATGWTPAQFDHAGFTDCVSCHTPDKPANHFEGQCANCHTTTDWKGAHVDHAALTDCVSCHTPDKPANHFEGQCSACHSTADWKGARFDHTGKTDCLSCHTPDKPANHFEGQCANCHTTTDWKNARFDHTGQTDC